MVRKMPSRARGARSPGRAAVRGARPRRGEVPVAEGVDEFEQAVQGIPAQFLGLDRHQVAVRGQQGGPGGGAQAGRAVDEDGVVEVAGPVDLADEGRRARCSMASKIGFLLLQGEDPGRDEEQVLQGGGLDQVGQALAAGEDVAQAGRSVRGARCPGCGRRRTGDRCRRSGRCGRTGPGRRPG